MRALALMIALSMAPSAQPVAATTADGEAILLLDDGTWYSASAQETPFRGGQSMQSAIGPYDIHVAPGWIIQKGEDPTFDAEFFFKHRSGQAMAATAFLSWEELFGTESLKISAESGLALFWLGFSEMGGSSAGGDPIRRLVGSQAFVSQTGLFQLGNEDYIVQLTAAATGEGLLVEFTFIEPEADSAAVQAVEVFHRSLEVIVPSAVDPTITDS